MALNVGANKLEGVLGHEDHNRAVTTDISNPNRDNNYADPSGEKMKALAWMGKGNVQVGTSSPTLSSPLFLPPDDSRI